LITSWVQVPAESHFPITNLPYGVVSRVSGPSGQERDIGPSGQERDVAPPRPVVRIGDHVLPLSATGNGLFDAPTLNPFLAAGPATWDAVRARLIELFTDEAHRPWVEPLLIPVADVVTYLPFEVADYVDFYASEDHATNVGRMFRPDAEPLLPNWKHLPVGYHGRAGTVVVGGTDIVRPCGQRKGDTAPTYGPSARLDIEAEVGFVVGVPTTLGSRVSTADFADHVFGAVLVNDWSARDVQAWEYVPLGPFLGKSFATSVSPWVVPLAALADARVAGPSQDPPVLEYLREDEPRGLDLAIEVRWNGHVVSRPPFRTMYWSAAQQLAHLTVNGASLRTGDLFASGTVSGPEKEERGSFLELTWAGAEPVTLPDGTSRTFLEDGDTISISATAPGLDGTRIGFGEVTGRILPARL
jgi:fumarylacetoacetase